ACLDEIRSTEEIYSLLKKQNTETKISSKDDYQVIFLKKTPKVISYVKKWNPSITHFGFKILFNVPKEYLFALASHSLELN
ncbi:phosphopantothenate--cysteine ligase, partial [Streptococcus suis]